jgi:hypothetical protein
MQSMKEWILASAVGALALSAAASASVIPPMTLTQVVRASHALVHGVVVDQFSRWEDSEGNRIIFTYTTLRVMHADTAHLPEDATVVVRSVGGVVDGYHQVLVGEVSFHLGEEVVAFLGLVDGWLHPSVVGIHQGKYTVVRGARGNLLGLVRDEGRALDRPAANGQLVPIARFAADLRAAKTASPLEDGSSNLHPLTPVR